MTRLNIEIDDELHKWFKGYCSERQMSMSDWVRLQLEKQKNFINNYPKEEEINWNKDPFMPDTEEEF